MKRLFAWTLILSFLAQSTGAEGIALLAAPGRAAFPPQQFPAARLPAAAQAAPKVQVPAEWGFYVLATGEILAEEAAALVRFAETSLDEARRVSLFAAPEEARFAPIDLARVPDREALAET